MVVKVKAASQEEPMEMEEQMLQRVEVVPVVQEDSIPMALQGVPGVANVDTDLFQVPQLVVYLVLVQGMVDSVVELEPIRIIQVVEPAEAIQVDQHLTMVPITKVVAVDRLTAVPTNKIRKACNLDMVQLPLLR
jgi:hypothetical protein